jgi:sporulation protein YlmC with PRC-barrel domain
MEVKNPQGDRLGKIEDVVLDLTKDRVAYVVLATSRGPFSAAKYHAVPLKAFQPSSDGKNLILNADKDKVANAEGFSKDAWPSPSNPTWGAQPFWQENENPNSNLNPNSNPNSTPNSK